jgi:hypothetical protein
VTTGSHPLPATHQLEKHGRLLITLRDRLILNAGEDLTIHIRF